MKHLNSLRGYMKTFKSQVDRIPILKAGIDAMEIMRSFGDSYIVGGAVRDIVLGKNPSDVDIATNVPMKKIESLFDTFDIGKNKDFGIVVVKHKGFEFEIAQFRSDGVYVDGRRPDSVQIESSFEKDASRRDFTINAMAIDSSGNIIDYFEGKEAIKNKTIKAVGDPEKRFEEDHLRMLRAVRFSSRLGFEIDDDTMTAMRLHSGKISDVAVERVVMELMKMADQTGSKFADAIVKLDDSGLLQHIFPEVVKMKDFEHSVEFHPEGGVWDHTLAALRTNEVKDPVINLAILFHDIGKIKAVRGEDGNMIYINHAKDGMDIIDEIADRLKLNTKTRKALIFAAGNHMKMHDFNGMKISKRVRLIKDDNWDVLFNVAKADDKARLHLYDPKVWVDMLDSVEKLNRRYANKQALDRIRKVINGNLVMELKNIKQGPELGAVIKQTIEWMHDNNINPLNSNKIHKYIKEL